MEIPGEIGNWKKISELGSGSFGTVLLWRNTQTDEYVAIKKCKFQSPKTLSAKQKDRWNKEVNFMKLVDHPNVIKYKEIDQILMDFINKYNPSKMPVLTMEYCTKGNLRKFITSKPLHLSGLLEIDIKYILKDITSGLKYLHNKNITHRDLKPENIVLQHCNARVGKSIYKIIDLGYAKELQDATLSFVGTLHYLAPEIFYSEKYDKAVDYWSIGMMAFELCCGILPFLPEMNPFERFENIKQKEFDHICIYKSYSGAFSSSSSIKRENFLSNWFKKNMETWFKYVFQLNPSERVSVGDIDSLDYLENILQKRTVNIYDTYNCSFYSYDVTDMTLYNLKNLISQEIGIVIDDLIFLISNDEKEEKLSIAADDDLMYLKQNNEVSLYVFKKNYTYDRPQTDLPNLIKELLKKSSKSLIEQIKPLYRQALYFTYKEDEKFIELKRAYIALISHIKFNKLDLDKKIVEAGTLFNSNCTRANTMKDIKNMSSEQMKCCEEVLTCLESKKSHLEKLHENIKSLHCGINEAETIINNIFDQYQLSSFLNKMNNKAILETGESTAAYDVILDRIRKVLNDLLKTKYKFFNEFKSCVGKIRDLSDLTENLKSLIKCFFRDIEKLSLDIDTIERSPKHVMNNKDSLQIIEENRRLRQQLDMQLAKGIFPKNSDIFDFEFDF